jgi:flagellin
MSITVNTNTQSLFAQRALSSNTQNMQRSIEKLSTGFRINRAADDAAGLSISEKLTAQIRGLEKASQNIGDGISLVQTAEGGLSIIQDNLQRIREIWVQGTNDTNGSKERDAIQREINERVKTIDDVAKATKFNGHSLLHDGTNKVIQSGADNAQTTTIVLNPASANNGIRIDISATTGNGQMSEGSTAALNKFRISGANVASQDGTAANAGSLTDLDSMLDNVSRMRSYLGAVQNSLESKQEYVNVAIQNESASRSRVKDVDVAKESSIMIRNQILQQSSAAMLSQANQTPQLALNLLP